METELKVIEYALDVHTICKGCMVNECTCGARHMHTGVTLSSVSTAVHQSMV